MTKELADKYYALFCKTDLGREVLADINLNHNQPIVPLSQSSDYKPMHLDPQRLACAAGEQKVVKRIYRLIQISQQPKPKTQEHIDE